MRIYPDPKQDVTSHGIKGQYTGSETIKGISGDDTISTRLKQASSKEDLQLNF